MRPSQADVARDRVLVHLDQAAGGAGAATLAQGFEEGEGLVLGAAGVFQGGAPRVREGFLAGAAVDHADAPSLAGPAAEIQVALTAPALVGASFILAAETFDGVHP